MSTSSTEDFAGRDGDHYILEKIEPDYDRDGVDFLEYRNRWLVLCRYGGCSCHFRNFLEGNPPEFWAPQEWFTEDPEDVLSTQVFYDLISRLVGEGHHVDVVTTWSGSDDHRPDWIQSRDVSLSEVTREAFRFMDEYRFNFVP